MRREEPYSINVEVWPIDVVLENREKLVSEIAGQNVQCVGNFSDDHQEGRPQRVFDGLNTVHVGGDSGWLLLPVIPGRFT